MSLNIHAEIDGMATGRTSMKTDMIAFCNYSAGGRSFSAIEEPSGSLDAMTAQFQQVELSLFTELAFTSLSM